MEPQLHYFEVLSSFLQLAGIENTSTPLMLFSSDPSLDDIVVNDVDLIFLDASHDYSQVANDLNVCDRLLSDTGLILLDDVGSPHSGNICGEGKGGVRQALLDFVNERPDYSAIFFEPPFWFDLCGLAFLARKPRDIFYRRCDLVTENITIWCLILHQIGLPLHRNMPMGRFYVFVFK